MQKLESVTLTSGNLKKRKQLTNTLTNGPKSQAGKVFVKYFTMKPVPFDFFNRIDFPEDMNNGQRQNIIKQPHQNSTVAKRSEIGLWR